MSGPKTTWRSPGKDLKYSMLPRMASSNEAFPRSSTNLGNRSFLSRTRASSGPRIFRTTSPAQPGAKKNEIRGLQDGALRACVTQSPEKGKANKALIALLSKLLCLRKSQFELIAGETARQKRFLVRDISPEELAAKIENAIGH